MQALTIIRKFTPLRFLALASLISATVLSVPIAASATSLPTTPVLPSQDSAAHAVIGVQSAAPVTANVYQTIDDGTNFRAADDNQSYVQLVPHAIDGNLTTAFATKTSGVSYVAVHARAKAVKATGTLQMNLYDGTSLIASGTTHTVSTAYKNFTDRFNYLHVSDASKLRLEYRLHAGSTNANIRLTESWLNVVYQAGTVPSPVPTPVPIPSPSPDPSPAPTPTPQPIPNPAPGLSIRVSGNKLVDGTGKTVVLRGVNTSASEFVCAQNWSDDLFGGLPYNQSTTFQAMAAWHANVVRIPLNEDCWLNTNGVRVGGQNYIAAIENEVTLAHQAGLYVILDLHWSAPGDQRAVGQNYAPDADHSVAFWQSVAATFKSDPAAIYDLYNEPIQNYISSDPWNCWLNGCVADRYMSTTGTNVSGNWKTAGINQLIAAVRASGATQPVLANGIDWGNDDTGWMAHQPTDPAGQVIAGAHIYPAQPDGQGNGAISARVNNWNNVYPAIGQKYPVLIGETGDHSSSQVNFLPTFLPYADAHSWSYLAWTWDAWQDGDNVLIKDYAGTPTTGEGTYWKDWLLKHQ